MGNFCGVKELFISWGKEIENSSNVQVLNVKVFIKGFFKLSVIEHYKILYIK